MKCCIIRFVYTQYLYKTYKGIHHIVVGLLDCRLLYLLFVEELFAEIFSVFHKQSFVPVRKERMKKMYALYFYSFLSPHLLVPFAVFPPLKYAVLFESCQCKPGECDWYV